MLVINHLTGKITSDLYESDSMEEAIEYLIEQIQMTQG